MKGGAKDGIEFLRLIRGGDVRTSCSYQCWAMICLTRNGSWARADVCMRGRGLVLFRGGIPVRVVGGEALARGAEVGPWIFAPNHSSYVDIFVKLALTCRRT